MLSHFLLRTITIDISPTVATRNGKRRNWILCSESASLSFTLFTPGTIMSKKKKIYFVSAPKSGPQLIFF